MTNVRLSPSGNLLIASNPEFRPILDEFSLPEDSLIEIDDRKSYREKRLGFGFQGIIFGVVGTLLAEKVWYGTSRDDRPHHYPGATFDRHLAVRTFWEKEKPATSKLYIPEYYAGVEHPDTTGAILMERLNGIPADELGAARTSRSLRIPVAERLGLEPNAVVEVAEALGDLLRDESSFYHSLFQVVPLPDVDLGPRNIIVDYDPSTAEITRITAIDL